jgi:hypothetical protein
MLSVMREMLFEGTEQHASQANPCLRAATEFMLQEVKKLRAQVGDDVFRTFIKFVWQGMANVEDKGVQVEERTAGGSSVDGNLSPFEGAVGEREVAQEEEAARPQKRKRKEHELGPARWARRQERARRFKEYMAAEEDRWNRMTLDAFNKVVFGDDPVAAAEVDQALWDDPEI